MNCPMCHAVVHCPKCNSDVIAKAGAMVTKAHGWKQKYKCRMCEERFVLGVKTRFSYAVRDQAISLIEAGMTTRDVAEYIKKKHGVPVSHVSVAYWVNHPQGNDKQ